ncbi:hypothetical protein [Rhizobium sp. BK060]|jgi:hypothetical protein|uniref:hypothetical protein n=1 Tax=Rhizobium sp. BK060 TaxID=2587096 RepID=UPI00160881C4|nr:hypothetical protein [Rhizobium sp. BK060]MBB3396890.1 hypothetical protein [Rhizobium sp. BK060]
MNMAYGRIALRYIAGYLVLKSILPQDIADMVAQDPDIAAVIGAAIAAGVEGLYALAKRRGWAT